MFGQPQWGIFGTTGMTILQADSVLSVEYAHDYKISDYPLEKGAFSSYNKVQTPFQTKVTFLVGTARFNFLSAIETLAGSLDLVTIITPDFQYPSANVTHVSYRRIAQNGVTLIAVEVWCEEIRIVGAATLSNSQSTNGATAQNNGPVQPQAWQSSISAVPPT